MILTITGGTGSLGRALTRQQDILADNYITQIRVISRDEQKQASLEREYSGRIELRTVLGDVRSLERIRLGLRASDYVIHAAALKMIERVEKDVPEAIQTNIQGTLNVQRACLENRQMIAACLVSTDKAVNPLNSYGFTKAMAEKAWKWGNQVSAVKFKVCRYGNVFGSRGSVIELWVNQAKEKKPLTITHEEMTRFFITVDEAAKFILSHLFIGNQKRDKELIVPSMRSCKMLDIASEINRQVGSEAGFSLVGMRADEKLHEELATMHEYLTGQVSENVPVDSFQAERLSQSEIAALVSNWINNV